jgi:hypothetical protein
MLLASLVGAERARAAAMCGGHIATIVGTNGANVLVGTNGPDVIYAGRGNDIVKGRGGKDLICGGPGNDYIDGGALHDVDRGQLGIDTCVSSPGGGVDLFLSCEDRTAFDLQMDDGIDWGEVLDASGSEPGPGTNVVTTLKMAAGGVGHSGYRRTLLAPQGLVPGAPTALTFSGLDDGTVSVALPFSVPFFGISYDHIFVSTNGWVAFGAPSFDYMGDTQFSDYRGFNAVMGQYVRGVMPFWGDLDLNGGGTVSTVADANRFAIKWDVGEFSGGQPPQRVFQLVLFKDGRIRFDYISSTAPDTSPNSGFIGMSDGTGTRGLNTFRRSPYTYLRANVTLPQATLPVRSTAGFKIPGVLQVNTSQQVTCTGRTATTFTGCTGGTGSIGSNQEVYQPIATPAMSILYTPIKAPTIAASAGTVTLTLPRGSTFVSSTLTCPTVHAPTATAGGFVRCSTPGVALGSGIEGSVTWTVPPNMGNGQNTPPNVDLRATWAFTARPRSIDDDEAQFAGDLAPTTLAPTLVYTGPSPAHIGDALTFQVTSGAGGNLAYPVLDITIPAHMHLDTTTFSVCGTPPAGFGAASVTCALPNGITNAYSGDLTFHANANGTYHPKVTFFAENAPTKSKSATLSVVP